MIKEAQTLPLETDVVLLVKQKVDGHVLDFHLFVVQYAETGSLLAVSPATIKIQSQVTDVILFVQP